MSGEATVDLDAGERALAVARERMRPGETITIRTPNAVASVRGAVVVTEVVGHGALVTLAPLAAVTIMYVLTGNIVAAQVGPTQQLLTTPVVLSAFQGLSAAGPAPGRGRREAIP